MFNCQQQQFCSLLLKGFVSSVCDGYIPHYPKNSLQKSQKGQFLSSLTPHGDKRAALQFPTTPLNSSPPCVLRPSALRAHGKGGSPWGCWFHRTRERERERERGRKRAWEGERERQRESAAAAFLRLLDVTKMEICISEKRHCGPLGPKKNKYFNNKHVHCLPPVTAPGYYFTLNAESRCWIPYAYIVDVFFFSWKWFSCGKFFLLICPLEKYH